MPTIITGETGVNQITSGTIVGADVSSSLDLTGKTVTLPSGAITSANLPAGSVLQVVNATYSITPSSSSNKILVIVHQAECGNTNSNIGIRLQVLRNSTSIIIPATPGLYGMVYANATISTAYLDSPATTSSVTYKTQFRLNDPTGTAYVQGDSATSTITLMEIKA
jgi:hypothetical protein